MISPGSSASQPAGSPSGTRTGPGTVATRAASTRAMAAARAPGRARAPARRRRGSRRRARRTARRCPGRPGHGARAGTGGQARRRPRRRRFVRWPPDGSLAVRPTAWRPLDCRQRSGRRLGWRRESGPGSGPSSRRSRPASPGPRPPGAERFRRRGGGVPGVGPAGQRRRQPPDPAADRATSRPLTEAARCATASRRGERSTRPESENTARSAEKSSRAWRRPPWPAGVPAPREC